MSLPSLVNLVYSKLMSKTHRESHIACGRFARNSSRSACLGKRESCHHRIKTQGLPPWAWWLPLMILVNQNSTTVTQKLWSTSGGKKHEPISDPSNELSTWQVPLQQHRFAARRGFSYFLFTGQTFPSHHKVILFIFVKFSITLSHSTNDLNSLGKKCHETSWGES